MACAELNPTQPGLRALLLAFEAGSGLCAKQLELILLAPAVIGLAVWTGWVLYGQFKQWTTDRNEFEPLANGALVLAIMGLLTSFLLM